MPLGDLLENRRLILTMIGLVTLSLVAAGLSSTPTPFLIASLAVGLSSVAVQMIVPFAANLAPDAIRGRVVGNVMSGLMLGIMLARPAASFIAEFSSWHVVFFLSAALMVVLGLILARSLPERRPQTRIGYFALIASMGTLVKTQPVLRRRARLPGAAICRFQPVLDRDAAAAGRSAIPDQPGRHCAVCAAGVAGAIASPIAGRLADRNLGRPATILGSSAC